MDNGFDIDGIFETFDENMLLDLIDDMRGIIGEKRFSDLVISIAQENSDIDHDDLVYIISDIVDVSYEDYLDLCAGHHTRHGYIDPDDLAGDRMMERLEEEIMPIYERASAMNDTFGIATILGALREVFEKESLIVRSYNPNLVDHALSCLDNSDDPEEALSFLSDRFA